MSDVAMTPVVVLIVCKTILAPPSSDVEASNSRYTRHENRPWAYEGSMMVCRRHEVPMFNKDEAAVFSEQACWASAIRLGAQWDIDHYGTKNPYRTWRVACPVRIVDTETGETIGWKLPECGHADTVICETDTQI